MGRNKMIAKSCPKCEMQVAVASKSCKCGHTFFASRRAADALAAAGAGAGAAVGAGAGSGAADTRRTNRVRRSQTQFYDAQHYEKQKRRSPKKRSLSGSTDDYKNKDKESATARARRRRALRRAQRSPPRPPGGVGGAGGGGGAGPARAAGREPAPLGPGQLARALLILQEINRKMRAVTWQPPLDT